MCTIWNGVWQYVIKIAGVFISFLGKVVQGWEKKKKCENEKFPFLSSIIF